MSKSIIKNSFYSVIKTVSSLIFPVISFSYASRILLADGMGKIDFSKSFVTYFVLIAMLGIQNYGLRECARIREDRDKLSKTVREIFRINLSAAVISYILFFTVILNSDKLYIYRNLLLINSLTVGLTAIGMEWLYNAVEDYKYIAVRTCIVQLISLICMLIFIKKYDDVWKYAIIQVISNGGAFLFNFIHSKKYIDWKSKYSFEYKQHLKPIFILFLMSALIQIFTVMDSTMLGLLADDRAVGLYSASHKISVIITSSINAAVMVLTPKISYLAERGSIKEIKEISIKALNFILILSIPATFGLIMLSKPIILIFSGTDFLEADTTSKIMALRGILVPLNSFIVLYLFIPLRKEINNVISTAFAAGLNLILNFIFIPIAAQNGAAIATVAAEFIELVINLLFLSKIISLKSVFKHIWQYCISAVPIIFICKIIETAGFGLIAYLLMSILISIIVYFIILIVLKNKLIVEVIVKIKNRSI